MLLIHAREEEERFMKEGYGVNRREVMHNDFVLIGPADDPAGIRGLSSAVMALKRIARSKSTFISRGDDSGTHKKEKALWERSGIAPQVRWYKEIGQGMGAALIISENLRAYTLADRGTYLAFKGKIQLELLVEGDAELHNPYGIIAVNPARHAHVNYIGAMQFIAWITSPEGQTIIRNFTRDGKVLFHPDAVER